MPSAQQLECFVYCESNTGRAERRPMGRKSIAPVKKTGKEAAKQAGGGPVLKLCGMKGVGHDLNSPYKGYPFDIAW